jgi:hypothetical protein
MAVINQTAQMSPMSAMMGPDVARQQYELAQNQRYADMLMQQAMQDQPQGQMVSGHYVPPSPVQGLAQLLKAYVGRKASDLIPEQQSKVASAQMQQVQNLFGVGGGTAPAQARDMALAGGALQGDVGPTTTNAARMDAVQTGTGSAMPIPMGMDRRTAMMQYMIDPKAYASALASHSSPAEIQKVAAAAGLQPGTPLYQAFMQNNLVKSNYIAPTTVAPGAGVMMPGQNRPGFIMPDKGIITNPQTLGVTLQPGYAGAAGTIEGTKQFNTGVANLATTPQAKLNDAGQQVPGTQLQNLGGVGAINNPFAAQTAEALPVTPQSSNTGVVLAPNPVLQDTQKQLNTNWMEKVLTPALTAAENAQNTINSVKILRGLNLETGFGADAKAAASSVLASAGVKGAEKYATDAQIFKTEGAKQLLNVLAAQKGVASETDAKNAAQTYAKLANTPQANQFIFDLAEAMAMQDQRKASYFQEASAIPKLQGNLPAISNQWRKVEGSIFQMPTMQKYRVQ